MASPGICTLEAQMTGRDTEAQRGSGFAQGHRAREEHTAEFPGESACRSAFPAGTNRHAFVSPDGGLGKRAGAAAGPPGAPQAAGPWVLGWGRERPRRAAPSGPGSASPKEPRCTEWAPQPPTCQGPRKANRGSRK